MFWITYTYENRLSRPPKRNWKRGPGVRIRVYDIFFIPPQHAPPPAADQHPESNAKPGYTVIGRDITTFTRERRRRSSSRRRSRRALGPRPLPRVQQTATVEGRARVTMAKSYAHKSIFVHGGRPTAATATAAAVAHATHTTYVWCICVIHYTCIFVCRTSFSVFRRRIPQITQHTGEILILTTSHCICTVRAIVIVQADPD